MELVVEPAITIAVGLPDSWNGRFQGVGGGGYAGRLSDLGPALTNGFSAATTDTGHSAEEMPVASFGLDENGELNWQLINDFASRSLHEMTVRGKALTEAYYGEPAQYAYWNGCSTGGRQGLMEAQRLPDDYDGILAGAPAINWDRFIPAMLWPQIAMREETGGPVAGCKLELANAAAVAACDTLGDGVVDGVIGDPRLCDFDPAELVGQETACGPFTEADARAIQKIWDGATAPDGSPLWYGMTPGTDHNRLAGPQPDPYPVSHIGLWVLQNPEWDWQSLDYAGFEEIFHESARRFNDVIGTDNPDLSPFGRSGGKVLIWHGWSDNAIYPEGTVDYYGRVLETMGKGQAERVARLFMAPGVAHCRGGAGPNLTDPLGALMTWVEDGKAPKRLHATKAVDGQTVQTRPVCLYPKVAQYKGHGDPNDGDNFTCKVV